MNRTTAEFESNSIRYSLTKRQFSDQYYALYQQRYNTLSKRIIPKAQDLWDVQFVDKIVHTVPGQDCFIVGTVYKDMPLKENALDEITRQAWIEAPPPRQKFTSDQDHLMLEDLSGRIQLSGSLLDQYVLITGMVVGVCGREFEGSFQVKSICFPEMMPPPALHPAEGPWIAFVSGLDITNSLDLNIQLLSDYLTGELGSAETQSQVSKIARVVIAGNVIQKPDELELASRMERNQYGSLVSKYDPQPLKTADDFLYSLSTGIQVDVMSGESDPTSCLLPQGPMHKSMFLKSCKLNSFETRSNPFAFTLNGVSFLGTSGQNVNDMLKYLDTQDYIGIAKSTIQSAVLFPTAPDTLWCHPFQDEDPFILDTFPNVYFIGNQKQFLSQNVEFEQGPVKIIMIPKFSETGTIVLYNLGTQEVKPVTFNTQF